MEKGKTDRGFTIIMFKDRYDTPCHMLKSSLADEDCIWFGCDEADPRIMASIVVPGGTGWVPYKMPLEEHVLMNTRMHLSRDQVKEILPILQKFVEIGEI
jgi:hypothetical protein